MKNNTILTIVMFTLLAGINNAFTASCKRPCSKPSSKKHCVKKPYSHKNRVVKNCNKGNSCGAKYVRINRYAKRKCGPCS